MFDPFPERPSNRPPHVGSGVVSCHQTGSTPDPLTRHWWVVGIGNAFRGDDAVGLHIARMVAQRADPHVTVQICHDTVLPVLDLFAPKRQILIVDAVCPATKPGMIHQLDLLTSSADQLPVFMSNHVFDLPVIIGIADQLDRLPATLLLVGVEAESVERGAPLSGSVRAAIPAALDAIYASISPQPDRCEV